MASVAACSAMSVGASSARTEEAIPLLKEPKVKFEPPNGSIGYFAGSDSHTYLCIERGDISRTDHVTAIVNPYALGPATWLPRQYSDTFPGLTGELEKIHEDSNFQCEQGNSYITKSGKDEGIVRVIHMSAPKYEGRYEDNLKNAYFNALNLAYEDGIRSIALPAIATNISGTQISSAYPFADATRLGIQAIQEYIVANPGRFNVIKLVYDPADFDKALEVWNANPLPN